MRQKKKQAVECHWIDTLMDQLDWSESNIDIGASAKLTRAAHAKFKKNTATSGAGWHRTPNALKTGVSLVSIGKCLKFISCLKGGLCKSEKTHPATAPLSFLPIVLLCDGPSMQSLAVWMLGGQVHTIFNRALHELCNVMTSEKACGIQTPPAPTIFFMSACHIPNLRCDLQWQFSNAQH